MAEHYGILLLMGAMAWGLAQLFWSSTAARFQQGFDWGMGPRDEPRLLSGKAARLDRAYRNYLETFPLFAVAMLVALGLGKFGMLALWGAHLYLWSRIIYTPLYLMGVPLVRTVVWCISIVGIVLILAAIVL